MSSAASSTTLSRCGARRPDRSALSKAPTEGCRAMRSRAKSHRFLTMDRASCARQPSGAANDAQFCRRYEPDDRDRRAVRLRAAACPAPDRCRSATGCPDAGRSCGAADRPCASGGAGRGARTKAPLQGARGAPCSPPPLGAAILCNANVSCVGVDARMRRCRPAVQRRARYGADPVRVQARPSRSMPARTASALRVAGSSAPRTRRQASATCSCSQ